MKNTPQFQIMLYSTTTTGKTPGQGVRADHFSDIFCCRADACIGIYHAKRMHPPPNKEDLKIQCLAKTVRRMTRKRGGRDSEGDDLLTVNRQSISAMDAGVGCETSLQKK